MSSDDNMDVRYQICKLCKLTWDWFSIGSQAEVRLLLWGKNTTSFPGSLSSTSLVVWIMTLFAAGHVTTCDPNFSTRVESTYNFCRCQLERKKGDCWSSLYEPRTSTFEILHSYSKLHTDQSKYILHIFSVLKYYFDFNSTTLKGSKTVLLFHVGINLKTHLNINLQNT